MALPPGIERGKSRRAVPVLSTWVHLPGDGPAVHHRDDTRHIKVAAMHVDRLCWLAQRDVDLVVAGESIGLGKDREVEPIGVGSDRARQLALRRIRIGNDLGRLCNGNLGGIGGSKGGGGK